MAQLLSCDFDGEKKIWAAQLAEDFYHENVSIGEIIYRSMKNWPNNVCQISDSEKRQLTSGEVLSAAIRIAQHLRSLGLGELDIIGIAARNSTYVMPLIVACLMNTTQFHAVSPLRPEQELRHALELTTPKVIFCDSSEYNTIKSATMKWQPKIYTLLARINGAASLEELLESEEANVHAFKPAKLRHSNQTMAILCSSGTTGMPKAVCMSNRMLVSENSSLNSETVVYSSSGVDWLTGLNLLIASAARGCTRIITREKFSAKDFVQLVTNYKINYVILPPRHWSELVACTAVTPEAMNSVEVLAYSGGIISTETLKKAQELFANATFVSYYGLTETCAVTCSIGIEMAQTAGKLLPGVSMRIIAKNGKNLGAGEIGEICVKHAKKRWNGYYNNVEQTRLMEDDDGWIHTGDMGFFDKRGYLNIVDRKKDIRKYEGNQYSLTDIEKIIMDMPAVSDATVFAIIESGNDKAGALVIKRQGFELDSKTVEAHVMETSKGVLCLHAGVHFVQSLPDTPNGKKLRSKAAELFQLLRQKK